jgi:hypothetical protein
MSAIIAYKSGNIFPWHRICYAIIRVKYWKKYAEKLAQQVLCHEMPQWRFKKP